MSDIYYQPEHYGLVTIGEVEWSDGCYQFDTTVVWRDVASGELFVAHDSGCSCPIPFEDYDRSNITRLDRPQDLIDFIEARKKESWYWNDDWDGYDDRRASVEGQAGELVQKVREFFRVLPA